MSHRKNPTREVLDLAIPAILHSLLQTLVLVVDRVMLGHHGATSLAAMQIAGPMEWSVWRVFAAFEVGTLAQVGFLVGAQQWARVRRVGAISLVSAGAMGLVVALLAPGLVEGLRWYAPRAPPEVVHAAGEYLLFSLGASPAVFLAVACATVFRAAGDTRTPLFVGVAACILHIPLNALLIFGVGGFPGMGPRGCGISTALTFTAECVVLVLILMRRRDLRPTWGPLATLGDELRPLLRIALPTFLERTLYHTGFLAFEAIIATLGQTTMAADQALITLESICFLSADGFGIAAAALVAQRLGAENPRGAWSAGKISVRLGVFSLAAIAVVLFLARRITIPLIVADQPVVDEATKVLPVLLLAEPLLAFGVVTSQALRGAKYTRDALLATILGALFVRVSASYYFAVVLKMGLLGIWMGSTCDWAVRAVVLFACATSRARALRMR